MDTKKVERLAREIGELREFYKKLDENPGLLNLKLRNNGPEPSIHLYGYSSVLVSIAVLPVLEKLVMKLEAEVKEAINAE